ncbi:Uncharacterized protein OS=Rhodopirellula sp. SWK7 GN=RRSWK_03312 PE=4 SV=1 [Gemmata massiliana]|uniref:Uncharacterized protein n=1 Tax=Gemmata massiliana TaxID=1210884 RepID=A0A6P2DFQ3_9BACT|nr:Uncharacterized protein OS=Rhodopirellula sp. SWK7 GN=RRSWK_03312 PE=4 SV=1 [Gemmata massiliana]
MPSKSSGPEVAPESKPDAIAWQPERGVRTCVATTRDSEAFGRLVGAEAQARNFGSARRRAFVGDGQAYNWAIRARWFGEYVAVVDFIHVLGYVWQATRATGGTDVEQWDRYARWMRGCWQGRASEALVEMNREQRRIGEAPEGAEDTDPRVLLGRARLLAEQRGPGEVPGVPQGGPSGDQFVGGVADQGDQLPGQGHREVLERARGRECAGRPSRRAQRRRTAHQAPRGSTRFPIPAPNRCLITKPVLHPVLGRTNPYWYTH